MFKKKKKLNIGIDEDPVVYTPRNAKDANVVDHVDYNIIKDINIKKQQPSESKEYISGNFTFYNKDPQSECQVDKPTKKGKSKQNKKDLSSFFEKSKLENKLEKEKQSKENDQKPSEIVKNLDQTGVTNEDFYTFRNIQFVSVDDFIEYLNDNYSDIESISKEALNDEKYYEWLKNKSNVFEDSINQFKDIKEKIEEK